MSSLVSHEKGTTGILVEIALEDRPNLEEYCFSLQASNHVVHLLSVQQLHHQGEELCLCQLGLLKDLLHRTKVGLNLRFDVLVHAQLHLASHLALPVHLDLCQLDSAKASRNDRGRV